MANNIAKQKTSSEFTELSSNELKEVQTFLKERSIDILVNFTPQNIRRMNDGGMVIDPPQITTRFVKVNKSSNGKLDTV